MRKQKLMDYGKFLISLDFELFWGFAGWTLPQLRAYQKNIEGALDALFRILDTLGRHDVKCTIGFVGGIACTSSEEFLAEAPEMRPVYEDPMFSSYKSLLPLVGKEFKESLFFAPDVIARLFGNPLVELGSHTFSHYYCLEDGQTAGQFEADIAAAVKNARKRGISLKTIIFPRNQVSPGYLDICAKYGFTHYRGNPESALYRSEKTPSCFDLHRILRLADAYFNLSGHNTYKLPVRNGSMCDVPASRFMRPYSSRLALLEPLKVRRILRSMEYAAKEKEIFHLWWHPHNFGLHLAESIEQLEKICDKFDGLRLKYGMQSRFVAEL